MSKNCFNCDVPLRKSDADCCSDDNECNRNLLPKLKKELEKLKEENEILKQNVSSWKDAWFKAREIIGKLSWHHAAIDSDAERAYYQNNLKILADKRHAEIVRRVESVRDGSAETLSLDEVQQSLSKEI